MTEAIVTNIKKLREKSRETSIEEVSLMDLVNRLKVANGSAWTEGCGLTAIQIGIPLRFAWFIFGGKEETLLNPKIINGIGKMKQLEGCLSILNKWTATERYYEIEYESHGKKKRAKGFKAKIIQHEIDHMNGILNIDHELIEPKRKKLWAGDL